MRLYFMCLIAFAVATFFFGRHNRILSGIELAVLILLAMYSSITSKHRTTKLLDYLESISDGMDSTVRDTPLPVVIYNSETNEIIWSNDRFNAITGLRDAFFELRINDVVPDFSGNWLLDGKNECPEPVSVGDRKYRVYGSMVLSEREYVAATYWVDVTEFARVSDEYLSTRPVFAILTLDNYDELLKGMGAKEKSAILSDIDEKISVWAGDCGGYLCKYDRDRYFFLFEERDYGDFAKNNFSILGSVRSCIGAGGVHATLSIGVGKDGATPNENYRFASLGVEMALSRGGDQAVLRNRYGFEYFGGHSPQAEKRTKVKSRIMAGAFGELLDDVSTIFIMGHKFADFDSVGAAIGICCIARAKNKQARIIIDFEKNLSNNIIEIFSKIPEYNGVFVSAHDAILEADSKSLLVVVDTTRPSKVESETMLLSCTRVAVIDHHRRAAEYIDNAVFNFHVPHASSTSELVTEMLEYLVDKTDVLRSETEALLAGIVLDTKGFSLNTGSRTFDAAAFLQRLGAEMATVKRLLQSDFETTTARFAIMCEAAIYREGIAIASSERQQGRLSIPQAADDLLSIEGVHTSFVAAPNGEDVFVSGRSFGGVNVQAILEKMGGGGSQSSAGLQVRGADVAQIVDELKKAIDEYLCII
jgi:c-di-AMP phosphodiesterase-like protein